MAAVAATADMTILKNSEILVKVEEALSDLIVVTYCTQDKKFQGVLLDSNKGNLPFGVYDLHPAFSKDNTLAVKDEKLHSVSQRFTYQEPQYATEKPQVSRKTGARGRPKSKQKMTVRLRPRKVLCSNCKGICNENNENVVIKRSRLAGVDDTDATSADMLSHDAEKKFLMGSMLIPKISRLHPNEISNAMKGTKKSERESYRGGDRIASTTMKSETVCDSNRVAHKVAFVDVCEDVNSKTDTVKQSNDLPYNSIFTGAKTIKICYGEGEGTVVKIPALTGDYNEDSGLCDMTKQSELKAAKKALKRAKKQAKKNVAIGIRPGLSPKHMGALSPRNNVDPPPNIDILEKRHKHKVKHKKKNKERDENASKCMEVESVNYFSDIKEHCLKQNLAIGLRGVSSTTCEKQDETESEDWESDTVPDFPENSSEGVGDRHISVSPGDIVWGKVIGFPWWPGRVLSVTLQSKAHVAWFASKTSSMIPCDSLSPFLEDFKAFLKRRSEGHVSRKSKVFSADNVKNFLKEAPDCKYLATKMRFNKKKKGAYKEAVKLATIEAKQLASHVTDPLASPNHLSTMSPPPIHIYT